MQPDRVIKVYGPAEQGLWQYIARTRGFLRTTDRAMRDDVVEFARWAREHCRVKTILNLVAEVEQEWERHGQTVAKAA